MPKTDPPQPELGAEARQPPAGTLTKPQRVDRWNRIIAFLERSEQRRRGKFVLLDSFMRDLGRLKADADALRQADDSSDVETYHKGILVVESLALRGEYIEALALAKRILKDLVHKLPARESDDGGVDMSPRKPASVSTLAAGLRRLADAYDASKPDPKPVVRAGQMLAKAIELGAFSDSRFTDLHRALQGCREGRTPLEGWRVYFETAVKWFAEHRDKLTDPPAFHEGPERIPPGPGYNGEWVKASLSAVATLLELEGVKSKEVSTSVGSKEWLKLVEAERLTGINRGTIARAAESDEIEDNGKTGRERRVRTESLTKWALQRAEKGPPGESTEAVKRKMREAGI